MKKRVLAERVRDEMTRCLRQRKYATERTQELAAATLRVVKSLHDEDEVPDAVLEKLIADFGDLELTFAREIQETREQAVQEEVAKGLRERIRRANPFS